MPTDDAAAHTHLREGGGGRASSVWPEPALDWLFVGILLVGLVWTFIRYQQLSYLPLPFFPDPNDVYGDGYNSAWWAFNGHQFDDWRTVYPPLSFDLIRIFSPASCYRGDVHFARDCDWGLWGWLLFFYVMNGLIAYRSFCADRRSTAAPRAIALMFGLPMIYSFEHLNMLVIAWTGLFLAFGPVLRSAWGRWLSIAVVINLKVYFVAVLLGQLLRRRWRWVEGALLMTAVVWAVAYAINGSGTPVDVVRNIFVFSGDGDRESSWQFVIYASSYTSMTKFLNSKFPLMMIIGSWKIEFWTVALTIMMRLVQAATLAAFVAIWLRPGSVTKMRLANLCTLLILISVEPGGYTIAGTVFFTFFERWRGYARTIALLCAYLQCLPFDVEIRYLGTRVWFGVLADRDIWQTLWLTAGPFVRPALLILVQWVLVWDTLSRIRGDKTARLRGNPPGYHPAASGLPTAG